MEELGEAADGQQSQPKAVATGAPASTATGAPVSTATGAGLPRLLEYSSPL